MIRVVAFACSAALLLTGQASLRAAGSVRNHPAKHGWMAAGANAAHAWLYANSYSGNSVAIFDLDKIGAPQIGEIASGISGPAGMTLDSSGNLYVANQNAANVAVYAPNSVAPSLILSQGLTRPLGVAVDAAGNVWVSNRGNPASIVVYGPGQTTPAETITNSMIRVPAEMFFDATGTLYVADNAAPFVYTFAPGSQQPVSLGLQGLDEGGGIAVDPATGNLFVGDLGADRRVLVYPPGGVIALRTLKGRFAADFLALGQVRHADFLFVPDFFSSAVTLFKSSGRRAEDAIGLGAGEVNGVAYKARGIP
jgi:hypothetical protein